MQYARIQLPVLRCPTCDTPYVFRLCHSLVDGAWVDEWLFQRDVVSGGKCRKTHPFIVPPGDFDSIQFVTAHVARLEVAS